MSKIVSKITIGIIVSMFLFPFSFKFLPGANTKMILAALGAIMYCLYCVQTKGVFVSKGLLGATAIAFLFSYICYYSAEYNHTEDYSYANYYVTFFVWMAGAYFVTEVIKKRHGESNLKILTYYLTGVCTVQCGLALLMDKISPLKRAVNSVVEQGQNFYEEIGRLYGIGASLDPAGVRFAAVLILISAIICFDDSVRKNSKVLFQLLSCYFIIVVVGNMIARTTTTGLMLSVFLFVVGMRIFSLKLKSKYFKAYFMFGFLMIVAIIISTYLYNVDQNFHQNLRFAFEGFFNWMETGTWRTDSTDTLKNVMWKWPTDTKTWIIGSGLFGSFVYSTDVGYCRFILYCGLTGFSVFAFFQIYNGLVFFSREKDYRLLFLLLIALSFIIWMKVATDIFQFYALFYCLDSIKTMKRNEDNS